MRQELKVSFSDFLARIGVIKLLRRATASRGGLVLAIHRVLPAAERSSFYDRHLILCEPAFVALLELLQQDYRVVPLDDLLQNPRAQDGRPRVALTFDDGWEDTCRIAFPHLLAYQMPATVFPCTGLIDTDGVLPEERFGRVWAACSSHSRLAELLIDLNHWGMGNRKSRQPGAERKYWARELKRMPMAARLLLLDHIEERYGVPPVTRRRFMSWDQLRTMANTGLIRLGSHTSRHATLPSEADRDIRRELEDSRAALLEHTGEAPEILAYPNGLYNRRVLEAVRSAGFKAALTTQPGTVKRSAHPLAIPRISIDDTTVAADDTELSPSRAAVYFLSSRLRSEPAS